MDLHRACVLAAFCQDTPAKDSSAAHFKLITAALRVADEPLPRGILLSSLFNLAETRRIDRFSPDQLRCAPPRSCFFSFF